MPQTLVFDSRVYSLEAVKKAAYRFSDVVSVDMRALPDATECTLHFKPGSTDADRERLVSAFRAEVLDQDLRSTIAKETEPLRNAILAFAFSQTGLQSSE